MTQATTDTDHEKDQRPAAGLTPVDANHLKDEQKSPAAPPKDTPHTRRTIILAAVALVAVAACGYIV